MSWNRTQTLAGLRAAAEPTRLRLICICAEGELTVSEITRIVHQSQPRVSRHLKLLCDAGLLMRFRERHWVFYRVPAKGPGADLVRSVLALLPADDETLCLDRVRMEEIKAERARTAARHLLALAADPEPFNPAESDKTRINRTILDVLDTHRVGDLLDIGTGTGRVLELLGRFAESAVGVDISADMLTVARSNLHAAGLNDVMVRLGDMYRLNYPDRSFDTVTVDQVLYQAEQPERVIAEAARILRPGGQLLIVDFAPFDTAALRPGSSAGALGSEIRLGVAEESLRDWLARAGLVCRTIERIEGETLTALLSVAFRTRRKEVVAA